MSFSYHNHNSYTTEIGHECWYNHIFQCAQSWMVWLPEFFGDSASTVARMQKIMVCPRRQTTTTHRPIAEVDAAADGRGRGCSGMPNLSD